MRSPYLCGLELLLAVLTAACPLRSAPAADDPLGYPDEFAWRTLARSTGSSDPKGGWEHWPNNVQMFTGERPDCKSRDNTKVLVRSVEFASMELNRSLRVVPEAGDFELRFNQIACESAVSQGLYELKGRIDAFRKQKDIQFRDGSIAFKGRWETGVCDPQIYHCGIASDRSSVRLIALHLAVKHRLTPNWFWATWEHDSVVHQAGYAGMCCKDAFGDMNGQATSALQQVLQQNGLGREWQHYHLVGTQTDFESGGAPTFLGNAAIETNATQRSSCITCHARASTNGIGATMNIFRCDLSCDAHGTGGTPHQCNPSCLVSYYGNPDPGWFRNSNGQLMYVKVGFLWSILDGALPELLRLTRPGK